VVIRDTTLIRGKCTWKCQKGNLQESIVHELRCNALKFEFFIITKYSSPTIESYEDFLLPLLPFKDNYHELSEYP